MRFNHRKSIRARPCYSRWPCSVECEVAGVSHPTLRTVCPAADAHRCRRDYPPRARGGTVNSRIIHCTNNGLLAAVSISIHLCVSQTVVRDACGCFPPVGGGGGRAARGFDEN